LEIIGLLFAFAFVTPVVVLGFIAFYWKRTRGDDRVAVAWQAYARRRRFTYSEPSGTWPNRTSPRIAWSEDGNDYRIEARGAEAIATTRVVARPAVAALGEIVVTRAGGEAGRKEGSTALGHRLVLWAHPAGFAERILTSEVKRALLGFEPASLFYRCGEVSLDWAGGEENDARLDEARAVVRRIVNALAATHPAVPPRDSEPTIASL